MNKSTTTDVGERGLRLTGRPDLKQAEKKLTKHWTLHEHWYHIVRKQTVQVMFL